MDLFKIVNRSKNKDNKAFQILFEMFYEEVYRVSYLITRSPSLAEDATQEAFLKAFERLDTLKEPRKFGAWVKAIATRSAVDILRQRKHMVTSQDISELSTDDYFPQVKLPMPETEAERRELRAKLLEAIDSLTPVHRQVVVLKYFLDFDNQAIAETLNLPLGTVKSRLHRALKILNCKLTEDENFPLHSKTIAQIQREGSL
ncbi:RNA polymerase sigma factor [Thermoanaerobacterium sp. DL9XJH110]|uniref:RNA polymerase sigma factor n=1 Tax=Thermoanaerobacterium sp. DL9XJH110 TaxID=3386643 RepID=UPI003BB80D15